MPEQKKEIILPTGSEIVIRHGRAKLKVTFDAVAGTFDLQSDLPTRVYLPVSEDVKWVSVPRIGEEVQHGWKYGGVSVSTRLPLFVAPKDEPAPTRWAWAVEAAAALKNFHGHSGSQQKTKKELMEAFAKGAHDSGVRLPTPDELRGNLYPMSEAIGGFDGFQPEGWDRPDMRYWSSSSNNSGDAKAMDFRYGDCRAQRQTSIHCVRLVRS